MVLKVSDYSTIKNDIDLDKLSNIRFYISKVEAISTSDYSHQRKMRKDAIKILEILKVKFPEYFL